jgi:magnesium chelatase family protein
VLLGPPGAGKSMLAERLPGILPPLTDGEAIETAMIHSVGRDPPPLERWKTRPFRAPHHSASMPAVIGGGVRPRPGEISLAHRGVLFLDELPEFSRNVLEALREPLETGAVSIARASYRVTFPARFQLLAAMNPCPCGYAGDRGGRCRCSPAQIQRYLARLSGPLIDRIDLHVIIKPVDYASLRETGREGEDSATVAARVCAARAAQQRRGGLNAVLDASALQEACGLGAREHRLLEHAVSRLGLSARACHRALRVARTVADLDGLESVGTTQLSEALGYRHLDRMEGAVQPL